MPVHDDRRLFEFLILEGAQAGLSWSTILNKRDGYREAFADFDVERVARFDARKVEQLMQFPGIVRNRLKIESAISNAKAVLKLQDEFGSFDRYMWSFVGGKPIVNRWTDMKQVPATSRRVRRAQQGPEEARLQVRRLDHHLRPHAGDRHGQRSRGELLPLQGLQRKCARLTGLALPGGSRALTPAPATPRSCRPAPRATAAGAAAAAIPRAARRAATAD